MKQLRSYQISAIKAVEDALAKGIVKQLVVLPTGAGKTFCAIKIVENKLPLLWCTHTIELLEQSAKAFISDMVPYYAEEINNLIDANEGLPEAIESANSLGLMGTPATQWLCDNIGVIKADKFYINKPIVFASIQTLWRRLDRIPADLFHSIVLDEAHCFGSPTAFKAVSHFTPNLLCGLTATPFRADGMMMGDIFDLISFQYDIAEAIKEKYLCQIDAIRVKTTLSLDNCRTTAGELNQKDLKETVDIPERNKLIVQKWKEYALNRPTICQGVDIEHCKNIAQAFNDEGIIADVIVGDTEITPDRKKSIDKFKRSETMIAVHCNILTAGFDYPEVACVINACPTKSQTKFLQHIGRGTRLKKNYKECIILDIVDSTTRHRLVNTYTLEKDKPLEERVFMTEEKRQKLIDSRNENNKKREFESKTKKDERVQLIPLPKVKQSNSIRMQEPATEKQLAWIARLGYDVINVHYTKLMCSEIISAQSATEAQIKFLKWKNFDVSQGVTIAEASKCFDILKSKEEKAKKKEQFKNLPISGLN